MHATRASSLCCCFSAHEYDKFTAQAQKKILRLACAGSAAHSAFVGALIALYGVVPLIDLRSIL